MDSYNNVNKNQSNTLDLISDEYYCRGSVILRCTFPDHLSSIVSLWQLEC